MVLRWSWEFDCSPLLGGIVARTNKRKIGWLDVLIIPTLGWRWAIFLTAPFALIGGVMRSVLPESPGWLIRTGRRSDAEAVLVRIAGEVSKMGAKR